MEGMVKSVHFSNILHQVMPPVLILGGFCVAAVAAAKHNPWGIAAALCMYAAAFYAILKCTPSDKPRKDN